MKVLEIYRRWRSYLCFLQTGGPPVILVGLPTETTTNSVTASWNDSEGYNDIRLFANVKHNEDLGQASRQILGDLTPVTDIMFVLILEKQKMISCVQKKVLQFL